MPGVPGCSQRIGFALFAGLSALSLMAQGNSRADRVRGLNSQVLHIHSALKNASGASAAALRSQAAPILEQRLGELAVLIEQDPDGALSTAFPPALLADLQAAFPGARFESHGSWEGEIEYLIEDDVNLTSHRSIRRMRSGGETLEIHFAGAEPSGLKSNDILRVRGVRAGNNVAAADGNITGSVSASATCSTFGAQGIVAILVNFPSYSLTSGVDQELVKGILYGNGYTTKQNTPNWSVDDFWQQNSDGQTSAPFTIGKVVGPYMLPSNYNADITGDGRADCDTDGIRRDAIAAADADVNFQNYSRVVIVMPPNGGCTFAGLGNLGCRSQSSPGDGGFTAATTWNRSDQMSNRSTGVRLLTHELGHNLTLHHASSRVFSAPREPLGPLGTAGTLDEYGDRFSTMGSWNFGFYSAHHAEQQLGWFLQDVNYRVVETSGTYSIQAYEARPAGLKALKVRRGTGNDAWVWIEFRQNQGIYDSQISSQVWSGALIHYEDSMTGTKTHLLDFTSGTTSVTDPALAVGQTWVDPYSNLSITVGSITSGMLNLTISYGSVPCTEASPTVTITPDPGSVEVNKTYTFSVSVRNNDSSGCAASTFDLTSTQPAEWPAGVYSPASLSIGPGQTATATLKETPTTIGSFPVTATSSKSRKSGSDTATLNVTAPALPLSATLDVPNSTYQRRDTIPITVTALSGTSPAGGATVTFSLTRESNRVTTRTQTTGSDGKTTWYYKINTAGTYTVSATVTLGSQTVNTNSDTFTVQ